MSTLLIEGGQRLSGSVDVEGNKNAALPLLAACLLTDRRVRAHQRAAHQRRRGDGAAAARSRRRGRGHRQHDAARAVSGGRRRTSPTARWSAGCAARCCCSGRCSRGADARTWRRPAATFPARRTISTHLEALVAMGAREVDGRRPRARGARRPEADVDLSVRGVGHRHRDGAARRGGGHAGTTEIRHAACEPHVVELCAFLAAARRRHHRRRHVDDSRSKAARRCTAPSTRLWGDYIEAGSWAVVAAVTGGEIDVTARAPRTWKSSRRC